MFIAQKMETNPERQRGMALVIVLIFLVVLTLLGVSGMTTTRMHEQIAGARHERVAALAASQAALSDGRDFVFSAIDPNAPTSKVQTINDYISTANGGWTIEQWVRDNTNWFSGSYAQSLGTGSGINYTMFKTNGASASRNPTFIVQQMAPQITQTGEVYPVYRVTSRGEGGNPENTAYLQSIHRITTALTN
jgi:type IV pilus assembly protein PilX